nr:succinyl-diaminopimelate desuccinylase [Actinomyces sp.]
MAPSSRVVACGSPRLPDLDAPVAELALALVNVPSVSGSEEALADAVESALAACSHLEVLRHGNTVVARTHLGRPHRVIVAGHLDTVPVSEVTSNLPGRLEERAGEQVVWGRGAVDMKGGACVILHLAAALATPRHDVTWVLYDQEEVTAERSGLGRAMAAHPDWFEADFAVLGEPTAGHVEGGCNGALRLVLDVPGRAAHCARAWLGANAVHAAARLVRRIEAAPLRQVEVEGLSYRESFNVVLIEGGVATNTVPDSCRLTVSYRFAPDLAARQALARALRVLAGEPADVVGDEEPPVIDVGTGAVTVTVDDLCEAARPALASPLAGDLVDIVRARGGQVRPKLGWTDVARFSAAGVPAVNLGPGDPALCHTDDEHCPVSQIDVVAATLRDWLA